MLDYVIKTSDPEDVHFASEICLTIETSARARGTGIAKRSIAFIESKLTRGDAFLAVDQKTGQLAGFCYIETWNDGAYVANSGLVIVPSHRSHGIGRRLKEFAFQQSRLRYPHAKLFGLTTSSAVMHMNSELGYRPVVYSDLPTDDAFWQKCSSCVNYETLSKKNRKNCLCTAMLFDPDRKHRSAYAILGSKSPPKTQPTQKEIGHEINR